MDRKDEEFLKRLLETFRVEAQEHLSAISSGLVELEKSDVEARKAIVETVFRECHSLKGAARSVNLADIVSVCQSMENVFAALKAGSIEASPQLLDLLHQATGTIRRLVEHKELTQPEKAGIKELVRNLDARTGKHRQKLSQSTAVEPESRAGGPVSGINIESAATSSVSSLEGTVRISAAKMDALLLKAEEMLSVKLAAAQRAVELNELQRNFEAIKKEWTDAGRNSANSDLLGSFEHLLSGSIKSAKNDYRASAGLVDALLDDVKNILMLPVSSLLESFPALVRNLSREAGKLIEFSFEGGDIEVDRRVLEQLKDPLIHLVRNCIDHGIEIPAKRLEFNKPRSGNIKIGITSTDGKIEITVADDGAGIDVPKLKTLAERSGAISREQAERLSDQEAALLIFNSGITSSLIITDISGRGLGLAIVKEKIEKLNGTVSVDSRPGAGTTFRMVVPMTLVTFRGVIVGVDGHLFVVPSANVEKVLRVEREDIRTVENRETIAIDRQPVSLVRLADVLGIAAKGSTFAQTSRIPVAVLGSAEKRIAFLTDDILFEQEVLVKPLGKQLSRVKHISGATVLGNGKIVPILNVPDLMKSAVSAAPSAAAVFERGTVQMKSILVAEDSITARTLLKTILESAGYDVKTAVDGIDAITALKTGDFDLVVSDVEMPRMNGFDLTAKIRADKKLSELPVILVTALESREDKERGIDVGANAYIVKSSFDQSNLLEVIGRLI